MTLMKYRLTHSITLALVLFAATTHAQDDRWYQVELLIFSHEGGVTAEQWEPLPELNYPGTGRFLVHPELVKNRQGAHGGDSKVDELGRQTLSPPPENTATDIPPMDAATIASPAPVTPTPFVALPQRSAEFYGKAAYMQRTGYYKTLFHETWVQPVRDESTAIPLIIDRSGDSGDWPRLQGTVKLHIARYLHIETNLWLNTQGEYLPGEWRMPAPPLGPLSLIIEEPEPEEETPYYINNDESVLTAQNTTLEEGLIAEETGPVYPWRHAVLLQQKRRMRSKEVHYIDHPLIGVVIKFMPLDEEQLKEMADAEFVAESAGPV